MAEKFQNIGENDVYNLTAEKAGDDIICQKECIIGTIRIGDLTKAIGGDL